ncbi:imidazole glycerol phosphate synthase subunit HisH [Zavarzinella formosa]|uniref:imidazole glycerol phosphate synthase subunit HisH n=1 Tax=Zavarzinella formosa TaxID=360055 RepID=UPI00030E0286|nr:imidazole glycerol phosphate synthase subunit HisH [Zavarzinella formosa]
MAGIVIVDYGMANLRSVQKAFERVGHAAVITSEPYVISQADRLVLPGVGAFQDAIARLRETHLDEPINAHINSGRPFLGICLGLQLLFSRSSEDGDHTGLNVLPGDVVRFENHPGLKVPHMGWNQLAFTGDCPLFRGIAPQSAVYFVHGYYAKPADPSIVSATADYPTPFAAAVWRKNLYATQFHPEKSQSVGLAMLKNFAEVC